MNVFYERNNRFVNFRLIRSKLLSPDIKNARNCCISGSLFLHTCLLAVLVSILRVTAKGPSGLSVDFRLGLNIVSLLGLIYCQRLRRSTIGGRLHIMSAHGAGMGLLSVYHRPRLHSVALSMHVTTVLV